MPVQFRKVALMLLPFSTTFFVADAQKLQRTDSVFVTVHASPWKPVAEKDIEWKIRSWREIPVASQKKAGVTDKKWQSLYDNLCDGIKAGKFRAYAGTDDRFTHPLSTEEFSVLTNGVFRQTVTKYLIKEDLLKLKSAGPKQTKIVGLAPVTNKSGATPTRPLFWIFYPDAIDYLAKAVCTKDQSWFDMFENRNFTSTVTKTADTIRARAVPVAENKQ